MIAAPPGVGLYGVMDESGVDKEANSPQSIEMVQQFTDCSRKVCSVLFTVDQSEDQHVNVCITCEEQQVR